ncbi:MAG: hypothetical protein WAM30_05970 [Candidatus Dormiibacterota bacterium]
MLLLDAGEWIPAYIFFAVAFVVATLGVSGLGWFVLRADRRNRTIAAARRAAEHEDSATS